MAKVCPPYDPEEHFRQGNGDHREQTGSVRLQKEIIPGCTSLSSVARKTWSAFISSLVTHRPKALGALAPKADEVPQRENLLQHQEG